MADKQVYVLAKGTEYDKLTLLGLYQNIDTALERFYVQLERMGEMYYHEASITNAEEAEGVIKKYSSYNDYFHLILLQKRLL